MTVRGAHSSDARVTTNFVGTVSALKSQAMPQPPDEAAARSADGCECLSCQTGRTDYPCLIEGDYIFGDRP